MPNLHWFGNEAEHKAVLSDILTRNEVEIFELYSEPEKPIRKFSTVDDILAEFDLPFPGGQPCSLVLLNLWVKGSGPSPEIIRFALNPEKCDGATWRERTGAVGFVRFYLERLGNGKLRRSETNTCTSEARLGAIGGEYIDARGAIWNLRHTDRFSSRLNRRIRKRAVAKIGSAVVLPGAASLWDQGVRLGQCSNSHNADLYTWL